VPTIKLTDNAGLDITASSNSSNSSLNKYLESALEFHFAALSKDVRDEVNVQVGDVNARAFPIKLSAAVPAHFKDGESTIAVKPNAAASIDLVAGDKAADFFKCLGGIDGPAGDVVSFGFTAGIEAGPSAKVGDVHFGLTSGQQVSVTNFRRVAPTDSFLDAVKQTVSGITIPRDIDDLHTLPPDNICRIEGRSSLKFSASVEYSFLNNTLASVPLEAIPQSLKVKAQSGAKLQVAVEHTSGHQLTVWRVSDKTLRLGVSLSDEAGVSAELSVSIGLSASVGGEDALAFAIRQISPSTDEEMARIKAAMPPSAQDALCGDIKKVLEGATADDLKASVAEAVEKSREADHLFVFGVDLDALDATSADALTTALRGDFTRLTAGDVTLAGVKEISNVLTVSLKTTHSLTIHLIGILNFNDVSSFVQRSKVALNEPTGEVVLTAEEIRIVENRLDPDHLREVLLRSAVITAGAATTAKDPDFTFKMVFFLRKSHPSPSDIVQARNALATVGSADTNQQGSGALSLYLSLDLNKKLSVAAFQNRTTDDYVRAGQSAMKALLTGDPASEGRLQLAGRAINFWNDLREEGSGANIERKLRDAGITDPAAMVDFFAIDWWAQAMGKVADALKRGSGLQDAEKEALKKSEGGFDLPWALIATYLLLASGNPHVDCKFSRVQQSLARHAP